MLQSFNAVVNFTVSRVNEPMSTVQQYEWAIKGWSKCSKECGGGKQHLVMRFETCSICFFLFVGLELVTAKSRSSPFNSFQNSLTFFPPFLWPD